MENHHFSWENYGKSPFFMGKLWKITIFHGETMENHHFSWVNQRTKWPCSIANCKRLPEGNETPFLAVFMGKLWEYDDKSSHFMVDFDFFIGATKHPAVSSQDEQYRFSWDTSPSVLLLWIAYTVDYSGPSIELVLCSILPCSPMIAKSPKCGVNAGQAYYYYHRGLPKMRDPKSSKFDHDALYWNNHGGHWGSPIFIQKPHFFMCYLFLHLMNTLW